jgi:hypothetical protein
MKMITKGQKAAIWATIRRHGIDEEEFRGWLHREYGVRSTRELSQKQAAEAIDALKVYVGEAYQGHGRTWGITGKQMGLAKHLADELGWDEPQRLTGLVKKMFGKPDISLLNKTEGSKLIVALQKMTEDGRDYSGSEGFGLQAPGSREKLQPTI